MNLQPFAALLNCERIDEYAGHIKNSLLANFHNFDGHVTSRLDQGGTATGVHALVLVGAKPSQPEACEDCYLAVENLKLAVRMTDWGPCRIGFARPWLRQSSIKNELKQTEVVVPVILGHPKAWPEWYGRHPLEIAWPG
jgi:nitroreductase